VTPSCNIVTFTEKRCRQSHIATNEPFPKYVNVKQYVKKC